MTDLKQAQAFFEALGIVFEMQIFKANKQANPVHLMVFGDGVRKVRFNFDHEEKYIKTSFVTPTYAYPERLLDEALNKTTKELAMWREKEMVDPAKDPGGFILRQAHGNIPGCEERLKDLTACLEQLKPILTEEEKAKLEKKITTTVSIL